MVLTRSISPILVKVIYRLLPQEPSNSHVFLVTRVLINLMDGEDYDSDDERNDVE